MNDFDVTFNSDVKPILMGAKTAQSYYRKNSVSALARDLVLQYPVLISADIPYDQAVTLSKALEIQYAALQIMVLSADTAFGVDPSSNAGVRDLISRYHSNNDRPNMVDYAGNMIYNIGSIATVLTESAEDEEYKLKDATVVESAHTEEFLESLWEKPLEAIETSSLNDLYNPSRALVETVSEVADSMEYAMEAKGGKKGGSGKSGGSGKNKGYDLPKWANPKTAESPYSYDVKKGEWRDDTTGRIMTGNSKYYGKADYGALGQQNVDDNGTFPSVTDEQKKSIANTLDKTASFHHAFIKPQRVNKPTRSPKPSSPPNTPPVSDESGLALISKLNNPAAPFNGNALGKNAEKYAATRALNPKGAEMMKIEKEYTKLEPTMIELEFFVRNGENSGFRKAVIGISTMPRGIPSDVMRANIIKALQHDNTGFKFIAWTRGEQKIVRDFMFDVTNIKEDAMAKTRYDKWFAALRKRKRNSKAFRGSRTAINPLTSMIITKNDAALIKQTSGFDLLDESVATKLMDSLYLLCFMVVDTDTGLVSSLLDGQKYFVETTVDHLKKSKNKGIDLTDVRETLKLLGR